MIHQELYYRWEWHLEANPEALWPLVADTNHFDRDTGLPPVNHLIQATTYPANARQLLYLFRFGVPIEWEQDPFEWTYPFRFGVVRRYRRGPVTEMRILAELNPQARGGTRLVYQIWARPKNVLGLIAIPAQIGLMSARNFEAIFRRYDRLALDGESFLDLPGRVRFAPGGRQRLAQGRETLLARNAAPDLVARLVKTLEQADDLTLARLRPYVLADYWQAPRRAVLELCLLATRIGLLNFQWDLLCPSCRGAKQSSPTLGEIQPQVHCAVCNIDFTINFDRLVELTFRPNPAIRQVESREFCVGGPHVTPHIATQQLLPPGARRTLTLSLEVGRYRLRTLAMPGGQLLFVADDGSTEATLRASTTGWAHEELQLAQTLTLHFENATEDEQLFILERMAWSDQAVTAAEVTALQVFRDLFANEALRPGEQISVGSLTILFTDLRNSTRLYREIGDAPAFGRVMDHFDVLRKAIAAEDGALVKTMGDSIMAVFRRPASALRAILNVQRLLASPPHSAQPLLLKAGIHHGPCIAVTLNDRLDYFGSTVNMASRLESLSSGRDVIISAAVRADPEVAEMLVHSEGSSAEPFEAMLKGYEEEQFELWRVTPTD